MERTLCIKADDFKSAYDRGMEFIYSIVKGLDKKVENNIILAFEEVFVNILKYNCNNCDLNIAIEIKFSQHEFYIKIRDNGKEFNPLIKEDPDFSLTADERDIGGMGIYLLKQITDTLEYEYIDNYNVLKFGVKLDGKN